MGNPLEDIKDEVNTKSNVALVKTALRLGKEIHQDFRTAILYFYSDYSPKVYSRTHSLFKLEKGVGGRTKYFRVIGNNSCEFGVEVDASHIPGNPYKKKKPHGWNFGPQDAFDYAYLRGIHGFSVSFVRNHDELFAEDIMNGEKKSWGFRDYENHPDRYVVARKSVPHTTNRYKRKGSKRVKFIQGDRPDNMMRSYFEKYSFDYINGVFNSFF